MAQDGQPRWFWPDQQFGLRVADDGSLDLISLDGVTALSILADGTLVGASKRAESFADPVAAQDLATKHYVDTHGGGGGSLTVTDGSHTVFPATTVDFTSGATVSDLGGGVAGVAVSGGGGGVSSFNTRTGAVTPQTGDYTAAEVGALPSTDTLHGIAATNANDGDVALNAHKITGLANGSVSTDAAAFGQIPAALPPDGSAGGDLTGSYPNPTLVNEGPGAVGPIGDATHVAAVSTDAKGRVSALSSVAITGTPPGGSAGGDLTGTYPNPTLAAAGGGAAGPIGSTSVIPVVTVDAKGRTTALTSASPTLDSIASANATGGDVSLNSHKLTNVTDPAGAQDAATKNYVDTAINGLDWKAACALATAAALPANVYNNGASGVGATLTGVTTGVLSIDGTPVVVGERVLVKNEAAPANNGIYVVTTIGTSPALYVLTRAADYNRASEIQAGDAVYVTGGTANVDTSWVMTTAGAITVGTTGLVFSQFGGNLVSSVFTRSGAVTAQAGDYTAAQVGALPSTNSPGLSQLVYRYTVTGSAKSSIDTGVDTPDAGSNDWTNGDLLEVFLVGGTDAAGVVSNVAVTVNNDGTSIYDRQFIQGSSTTPSAASTVAAASWSLGFRGSGGLSGQAGTLALRMPGFAGTTFNKAADVLVASPDSTAGNQAVLAYALGYRSTSAIERMAFAPVTVGTNKFKVGTQLLIYKRLAS